MKDKPFDITLTINLRGISKNNFIPNLLTDMFVNFVSMINSRYKQTHATIEKKDNLQEVLYESTQR